MTSQIKHLITAAVAAALIAGSGMALARDRDHDRDYDRGHHSDSYDRQHSRKHHRDRDGDRHHYKQRRHYKRHGYYARYNDNDDEKLLIGLIVGGLIGYAINDSQHHDDAYYDQSYPRTRTYDQPIPAVEYEYRDHRSSCLQEREYQTTVIVGGNEVDAYGTACLQPDGSWNRGPVKLASF